ncbi:hypothetical protein AVEN_22048-1 [Araneus ventricosus]|uniref:Uncharacterized protein n=1 Tax=Araneus ventricosus TaxID=182803 RepID=A0A4Y2VSC8_ARAVE|nr:hypothetical protein AVEN_22048-1 [Araneus ventricosus]
MLSKQVIKKHLSITFEQEKKYHHHCTFSVSRLLLREDFILQTIMTPSRFHKIFSPPKNRHRRGRQYWSRRSSSNDQSFPRTVCATLKPSFAADNILPAFLPR